MLALLRDQKGSVVVLTALGLIVIIGFASLIMDIGLLYYNKEQLSVAADAAALAGARDLSISSTQAVATANSYAALNGKKGDIVTPTVGNSGTSLTVTIARPVTYLFAWVFGLKSHTVSGTATATLSAAGSATGIMPFGITKQTLAYGQSVILKQGTGITGNYGALALGGNGANNYRNNIENGYSGLVSVGDWLLTEPGNIVGPTDQGVDYRIGLDPSATFNTVQSVSPRIVIVPVIDSFNVHGKKPVLVDGFAVFFLESSNGGVVTGEFMQMYSDSSNVNPGTGTSYGLYNLKLTQ